jgi:hypothetical protein
MGRDAHGPATTNGLAIHMRARGDGAEVESAARSKFSDCDCSTRDVPGGCEPTGLDPRCEPTLGRWEASQWRGVFVAASRSSRAFA